MLSGEPYLNGYLDKIDFEAATSAAKHGLRLQREVLVEGRLVLWTFQKAPLIVFPLSSPRPLCLVSPVKTITCSFARAASGLRH